MHLPSPSVATNQECIAPSPSRLSLHGISCPLGVDDEVVATYGNWQKGHLLIANQRTASLSLSWRRSTVTPDLDRTLAGAGKRMSKEHVGGVLTRRERLSPDSVLGYWQGANGNFHACVRHFPKAGVCLVLRQLTAGTGEAMRARAVALEARGDDEPWDWNLYGLQLGLPPWWRLEGIQQLAGLVRAVWFRLPNRALRPDQVLVMRRMAGAARILKGRTLAEWLRAGLASNDILVSSSADDGVVTLRTKRPAASWWRRWRKQHDQHDYTAWIAESSQRLTLQEWTGTGPGLACLRSG